SACLSRLGARSSLLGWRPLAQYHLARMGAYTVLGVAFGLASAATLRSWLEALGLPLGVVLGASMLAYALCEFARALRARKRGAVFAGMFGAGGGPLRGQSSRLFRAIERLPAPRPVVLGIATAL